MKKKRFRFRVENKIRVIKERFIVTKFGKFEIFDLFHTVDEVAADSAIKITNEQMYKFLNSIGVVGVNGDHKWCIGAEKGPNCDRFYEWLRGKLYDK